ncbi:peptidoglycan-binding protein LysM [Marinicella meishanensis]|uniref:peptidoglycan-binding protein LysM n=1 Tax=Marinicella meishanensis TaxID=2873263 RepID=UPI001CBAB269|nr:peptidoglycan-binding protein LysM [Marinicella sp. NBU2979]
MGFFDFLADAGSKVFGKDEKEADVTLPIIKHIENSGVDISHMKSKFAGGVVTLSGYVPNQEQKEKSVLTAGNIAGVSRVQDNLILGAPPADAAAAEQAEAEVAAAEEGKAGEAAWESKTYTVQPGDTLGKIAKEFYGNAMEYPKIFEANKPMLKDPDKIYPGQVLRIP